MKFLETQKILRGFQGGKPTNVYLGMSGLASPLIPFIKAMAAQINIDVEIDTPPFGTLHHAVLTANAKEKEIYILFPWDILPELDWRTGFPEKEFDFSSLSAQAMDSIKRFAARESAAFVYIQAPTPPFYISEIDRLKFEAMVAASALRLPDCISLPPDYFSLAEYCAYGCPFASSKLGDLARVIRNLIWQEYAASHKVLVTDLDNVVWRGVVSEDGLNGIEYEARDGGYIHFLYQEFLRSLVARGILLAAVSRNDQDVALSPFKADLMALKESHFVSIVASYQAKSAQIDSLAEQMNLPLEAFVFIDDNELEIAEVSQALPSVTCLTFPKNFKF